MRYGLWDSTWNKVVHHDADIGFGAVEDDLVPAPGPLPQRSRPAEQPCARRFFIAGRAVDLPGQEKPLNALGFQRRLQLARVDVVVSRWRSPAGRTGAFSNPGIEATTACWTSSGSEVEMPFG